MQVTRSTNSKMESVYDRILVVRLRLLARRICSSIKLVFFLLYCGVAVLLLVDIIASIDSFTPRLALITKRSSKYPVINHSNHHHVLGSSSSNESLIRSRFLFEELKHLLHNDTKTTSPFIYYDKSQEQQQLMMKIVQCGRFFGNDERFDDVAKSIKLRSPLTLVPGCVANVHVSTTLIPIAETENVSCASQYHVKLDGTADALISRGLLALIAASLDSTATHTIFPNKSHYHVTRCRPTAQDILNIDPNTVTDSLGLRSTLSRGRNDGHASIVTTVQNQIRTIY